MNFRVAVLMVVLAALAFGQSQPVERVFHFTNAQTPQGLLEVSAAIRTAAEVPTAVVDNAAKTLMVSGTQAQVDTAAWLFSNLDVPPGRTAVQQYSAADGAYRAVGVFYYNPMDTFRQSQEIINVMRSILEIQRAAACQGSHALVLRGAPEQMAAAEWLFQELDRPVGASGNGPMEYRLDWPKLDPGHANVIRLLARPQSEPAALQEEVNAIRSVAEIMRAVVYNEPKIIALRGTADEIALAGWLLQKFDAPANTPSADYPVLGTREVAGVLFPAGSQSYQSLQDLIGSVRAATGLQRAEVVSGHRALALRGTPEQIARAEKLVPMR